MLFRNIKAKYENTIKSLKSVDVDSFKNQIKESEERNAKLAEMNAELLEQYKLLSAQVAAQEEQHKEPKKKK